MRTTGVLFLECFRSSAWWTFVQATRFSRRFVFLAMSAPSDMRKMFSFASENRGLAAAAINPICRPLNSIVIDSKLIGDAKKCLKYSERLQNI
jgi:hypothetical protein